MERERFRNRAEAGRHLLNSKADAYAGLAKSVSLAARRGSCGPTATQAALWRQRAPSDARSGGADARTGRSERAI